MSTSLLSFLCHGSDGSLAAPAHTPRQSTLVRSHIAPISSSVAFLWDLIRRLFGRNEVVTPCGAAIAAFHRLEERCTTASGNGVIEPVEAFPLNARVFRVIFFSGPDLGYVDLFTDRGGNLRGASYHFTSFFGECELPIRTDSVLCRSAWLNYLRHLRWEFDRSSGPIIRT